MSARAKAPRRIDPKEVIEATSLAADQSVEAAVLARDSAAAAAQSGTTAAKAALIVAEQIEKSKPAPPDPRAGLGRGLLSAEQGTWARLNPRRSRWPELNRIDEKVNGLDQRRAGLVDELAVVNEQRATAEQRHADQLATWFQDGQRGERPGSDATVLDERLLDLRAEHAAVETLSEKALGEKIDFVKRNRRSLAKTAATEVQEARGAYEEAIDALERTRDDLIAARGNELWTLAYPSEALNVTAPTHSLAGGVKSVNNRWLPGLTSDIQAAALLGLLRDDGQYIATMTTVDLKAASLGIRPALLDDAQAFWGGSEEDLARQEREKVRARERHTTEFGLPPAEYSR